MVDFKEEGGMAVFSHFLWKVGRLIHLSPSVSSGEYGGKSNGKGKEKKEIKENESKPDIGGIELKERSRVFDIEKQVIEEKREEIRSEFEKRLQKEIEDVEKSFSRICDKCGEKMEYKGRCKGGVKSLNGRVSVSYGRFWCAGCKTNKYPAIEKLGIEIRSWTPLAQSVLTLFSTLVPFSQARALVKYFFDIEVSETGLWKLVKRVGQKIINWEEKAREVYNNPLYEVDDCKGKAPDVIEMSIDGAMNLCRGKGQAVHDEQDSLDPQPPCCGREVKTAVVFRPSDRVEVSKNRRALMTRKVISLMESADKFFSHLWAFVNYYNLFCPSTLVVIVADGASWIWNRVSIFPNRIEILDFWHAIEHAWDCAKSLWPDNPRQARKWVNRIRENLKSQGVESVIEELKLMRKKMGRKFSKEACKKLQNLISYYTTHASRMNYPYYIAHGYSIGSGSVESVHKQLIHARMRLAGMRWSDAGASRMVALRTHYLNGCWNEVESLLSAA